MFILDFIINKVKRKFFFYKWRKLNKHNTTSPINEFTISNVSVGKNTYGGLYVLSFNDCSHLYIGSYCSIAPSVAFVLSADHYTRNISSFPYKVKVMGEAFEGVSKGDIIVDDDVWIGYGATILSGVHIGQGAVIAAGAVVTSDIPPYAIVGGVPAKVIKYRFEPKLIEDLLKIDYNKLTKEEIEKNINNLYTELKDTSQLDWMQKK